MPGLTNGSCGPASLSGPRNADHWPQRPPAAPTPGASFRGSRPCWPRCNGGVGARSAVARSHGHEHPPPSAGTTARGRPQRMAAC
jgi:hypothetical protein